MERLTIHHPDAEPYNLDTMTLDEAIDEEATNVASMVGSDHLSTGTDEEREEFRHRIIIAATRTLRYPGTTYTDPLGTRWTLEDVDE